MKIKSLHIYGFGQIKDTILSLDRGINIIEGLNEAGKSTIMAFIQAIIFGFEGRRNLHLRYEPINGGKMGGALDFIDNDGGVYRIERIYLQKVTGDVKVYLPNGETAGEDYIAVLLGKVSDKVFKQVFSFGLTELQQIESLADSEINDFIYHAGTGSVNQILNIKQFLEQKQQKLFKNSGKNPEINSLLIEMDNKLDEIESIKQKNEQHQTINEKIRLISQEVELLVNQNDQDQRQLAGLEKIAGLKKPYQRLKLIERELIEYPDNYLFPENGVERLNNLIERYNDSKIELDQINSKIAKIENELNQIQFNSLYIENEDIIAMLRDELNQYKEQKMKKESLEQEQNYIQQNIADYLSRLGSDFDEQIILSLEFTINDKQHLQDLAAQIQSSEKQYERLIQEQEMNKARIEQLENNIGRLEQEANEQQRDLEITNIYPKVKKQWQIIREQSFRLAQLQEQKQFYSEQTKEYPKRFTISLVFVNILLYLASALFFYFNIGSLGGAFFALAVIITVLLSAANIKGNTTKKAAKQIKQIEEQIFLLENEINKMNSEVEQLMISNGFNGVNQATIDELDLLYNSSLENQRYVVEKRNRAAEYQREIAAHELELSKLDRLELGPLKEELIKLKTKWEDWLKGHHFYGNYSPNIIFELIAIIQATKELINKSRKNEQELIKITRDIAAFADKTNQVAGKMGFNPYLTTEERVNLLYSELKANQRLKARYDNLLHGLKDIMDVKEAILTRLKTGEQRINELLAVTGAKDQEAFYKQAAEYNRYQALNAEQRQLIQSIRSNCLNDNEFEELMIALDRWEDGQLFKEIELIKERQRDYGLRIKALLEEKGSLANQLNLIENDQKLSHLNQEYINMQAELKNKLGDLLTVSLTKSVLEASMRIYETEKQPKVIKQAAEYFKRMTANKYPNIIAPIGSSNIEVVREDSVRFLPQYLSRGTVEQLFLAMRFALVKEFSRQLSLPIIMDDIFVNFDYQRLDNTIDVLDDLSNNHQVLLFTCHPHVTNRIQKKINRVNHIYLGIGQSDLDGLANL